MIFAGGDPSIASFGLGVIERRPRGFGLVHVSTLRTKTEWPLERRLDYIADGVGEVVRRYHPEEFGIEELRHVSAGEQAHGRYNADNSQTFLAAGVAFTAARAYGSRPRFVNPQRAKVAVLGKGGGRQPHRPTSERELAQARAERKRMVRAQLGRLLGEELDCALDGSDALSFALLLALEHGKVPRP